MFVNRGMYHNQAIMDVDYIDENTYIYHEDGDLCLKLWQKGFSVIDSPDLYIEHYTHANLTMQKSKLNSQKKDLENI